MLTYYVGVYCDPLQENN